MKLSRYLPFAALFCFVLVCLTYYPFVQRVPDIQKYNGIAEMIQTARASETLSFQAEYPPLASALFYLVKLVSFGGSFALVWVGLLVVLIIGTALYARKYLDPIHKYSLGAAIVLVTIFMSPHVAIGRYEFVLVVLLFLMWKSFLIGRHRDSALFLTIATAFKLTPVILFPLLFLYVPVKKWRSLIIGILIGVVITTAIPVLLFGWNTTVDNVKYMLDYHGERGVQAESIWSGVHMLTTNLVGGEVAIEYHHGSHHNMDISENIPLVSSIIVLAGMIFFYFLAWRRERNASATDSSREGTLFLVLMWAVLWAPVFSPQYLLWFMPLLLIWIAERMWKERSVGGIKLMLATVLIFIIFATHWIYPAHYNQFVNQESILLTIIHNLRNVLLLISAYFVWREMNARPANVQ